MKYDISLCGVEVIAVGETSLIKAQLRITACAACSESACNSFGSLLASVLETSESTEYLLSSPAHCPKCAAPIFETSLVHFAGEPAAAEGEANYFEPCSDETNVVFIDEMTLMEAQNFISGCEHCSDVAEIAFDHVLDGLTGLDPTTTEYVVCHAAKCPKCDHDVMEKTLIAAH